MSTEDMHENSPEAYATNPLVRVFALATSENSVLKKAAFILDAATETITPSIANSPKGVIAYFGTFVTALEQEFNLIRNGQGVLEPDQIAAHLFLLEKVLGMISPAIVQSRGEVVGQAILDAMTLCVENAGILKYALNTVMPYMRALDHTTRKGEFANKLFSAVLILALDSRPKIRQQAQRIATSYLLLMHFKSPNGKGVPKSVSQTFIRIVEHELDKCKPSRNRNSYLEALYLCGLLQTTIYLLPPVAIISVFTRLATLAAEPEMHILQIQVYRVLSALFIQGVQTRYIRRSKLHHTHATDDDTPVLEDPYFFEQDRRASNPEGDDQADAMDDDAKQAREKDLERVALDAPLIVELINTFASIPPEPQHTDTVQAYARMLRLGLARLYALSPTHAHSLLPKIFANLAKYLSLARLPLVIASAAAAMRDIVRTVIDADMVNAAVSLVGMQARSGAAAAAAAAAAAEDEDETGLSPLENVIVQCIGLLGNAYRLAWPSVFAIVHALASRMTPAAAPLLGPILTRLDTMHISNSAEEVKSGVEYVIGAFITSAGPEAVLEHLPLNLPSEITDPELLVAQYAQGRPWLLDLLSKHVVGAKLSTWIETILPVALSQAQISEYLSNDQNTRYEAAMVGRLSEQAWDCFPAFCDLSADVPTAFTKKFAKKLTEFLTHAGDESVQKAIMKGLRVLSARNLMVSKGLWGKNEAEYLLHAQVDEEVVEENNAKKGNRGGHDSDSDSDSDKDSDLEADEDSEDDDDEHGAGKRGKDKTKKNVKEAHNVDAVEELSYYGVEAERYKARVLTPCPLTIEQASANLAAIAPFAQYFLPILFNISSSETFKARELVLDTTVAYMRVAPEGVQVKLFETALEKLKSTLAQKAEVAKKFEARRLELEAEEAKEAAEQNLRGTRLKVDRDEAKRAAKSTRRGADYDGDDDESDANSGDESDSESDESDQEEEEDPESKDSMSVSSKSKAIKQHKAQKSARARKRELRMQRDAMSGYVTSARSLFDILIAMMPALPTEKLAEIAQVTLPCIHDIDHMMQRKAYQVITKLATTNPVYYRENWMTILDAVKQGANSLQPGSAAARMSACEAVFKNIPDVLDHEEVREALPEILSEALLGMKDLSLNARQSSVALIRGVCGYILDSTHTPLFGEEALRSPVKEYFDIIAAGFASATPLLKSAAVTALARLIFEFRTRIPQVVITNILETALLMLQYRTREIVKAVLGFIKVACLTLTPELCVKYVGDIMKGVTGFSPEFKARFKGKVRTLVSILIKKVGVEPVRNACPASDQRLVDHIRKVNERLHRQRLEMLNERNKTRAAAKGLSTDELALDPRVAAVSLGTQGRIGLGSSMPQTFEDVLRDDDVSDDEIEGRTAADVLAARIAKNQRMKQQHEASKRRKKDRGLDVIIHDDVDLADPSAAHFIQAKHGRPAGRQGIDDDDMGGAVPMTKSGKLDFVALQKQIEAEERERRDTDDGESLFGKRGRREESDDHDRQLQRTARERDASKKLGHQYASEKGAGDARRKHQTHEPYAYIPLDPTALNKRNKHSVDLFKEAFSSSKKTLLTRKPGQKLSRAQRAALRKKGGRFPSARSADSDDE